MNDSQLNSANFQRILLIKPSALGDVIHTVPILAKLRQRYPEARVDWMLNPAIAEWIGHHPALSRVVEFDRHALARARTAPQSLARLLAELRGAGYDLVIDLHGQFRSALLALATGAPVRIGFDRPRKSAQASSRPLTPQAYKHGWTGAREKSWIAYSHHIPIPTLDAHAVDRYLRLGPMLGFPAGPPDFRVPIPLGAAERVDEILAENFSVGRPLLLLSPGTVWETKRWPARGFAAVANHFLNQNWNVALVGSRSDRTACDEVMALCAGLANFCDRTKLSELAALVHRADLCVTNDSGPMHLAVALGRPVVSIFGPTDPLWIGPYGRPDAVVRIPLPCSPCYFRSLSQCPNNHVCMHNIEPREVIERAQRILNEFANPPGGNALAAS